MLYTKAGTSDAVSERELRNRDIAYQAACESIVLMKNDGALPFKGERLACFGAGVAHTIKGGTGSGEVNERRSVTIAEGLEQRGITLSTRKWLDDYEAEYQKAYEKFKGGKLKINPLHPEDTISAITARFQPPAGRAVTKKDIADSGTENCIYVLSRQAGEGGDRKPEKGNFYLTDGEIKDITFCAKNYKHFVLVINCGSPVDMAFADDIKEINAILYISQLGSEGGLAVADVLTGAVTPSGKLTDTWADYDLIPYAREYGSLNGNTEQEYYKEGIYVGYRYFDTYGVEPRYPFGFGMSYASFDLGRAAVSAEGTEIKIKLTVRNTSRRFAGKETVQVYVSAPNGKLYKEYQRLAAFGKTPLLPAGKSAEVELCFDMRTLASYRFEDASFVLEKGDYVVRVGTSSRSSEEAAVLRLDREAVISRHQHVCPVVDPFLELRGRRRTDGVSADVPVLPVSAKAFTTVEHSYDEPVIRRDKDVRRFVDGLTDEEMTELVVGVGMNVKGRFILPGAVGATSSAFWDRGLADVMLCDGPAGLRILRRAAVTADGEVKPLEMAFSFYELLPAFVKKRMLGEEKRDTVVYQFATAFPVASALAQSWNTELLYDVGKAIWEEMREFGCTWWLAPAINIHRNPLCGRNFEYFSEDPFLCGTLAAALVRGVQQEEGYYVTIKHFACNNQEDNRNKVSANVSERALREIYLSAFEICVREGGAKSVMTSYNRVNGVAAPNSYDLCTKVLRSEWGFDGVVMTDWFSTLVVKNGAALAMKAGNDLIMPGEAMSKKTILRAVRSGLISRDDLRRCCCNVVRAIMDSAIQKEYIKGE